MDAIHRESLRTYPMGDATQGLGLGGLVMDDAPIRPLDVMVDAWNMTIQEQVLGSSTLCVATLDHVTNQLSYSNLGDCGLVIMRHIDSETAGYMRYKYNITITIYNGFYDIKRFITYNRERQLPRHLRKNDLRIAYLAQQQLRSFNLPYQLGYFAGLAAAGSEHKGRFETPKDADTGFDLL
jgi:protein phosphatase PTC7